ncbi:hypothetical protein K2173_007020 [Erythroxylum novogranatense]|uniref:Gnk2-homologous domain-containing protein n=1 Tax=Erythroxylum novogranatense TaxID=1862640 RepID=A0AAV8SKF7_9ROSI|nr:hypothetical protein K2173_007020 [Erythroxylum novogranatense]
MSSFYLLAFALLLPAVLGHNAIQHDCSVFNFYGISPYKSNLKDLMSCLLDQTPATGFVTYTVGSFPNRVYGLALCRGDIQAKDCGTCITEATREIQNLCPSSRSAIMWYDNCMIRYSPVEFSGSVDYKHYYHKYNVYNKIKYRAYFVERRNMFLRELVRQVDANPKLYATAEMEFGSSTFYGLVQCTRDLSRAECKRCLNTAIRMYRKSGDDMATGWFGFRSCNLRYETYPFCEDLSKWNSNLMNKFGRKST